MPNKGLHFDATLYFVLNPGIILAYPPIYRPLADERSALASTSMSLLAPPF